jgi:pyruvate-formate lyase-activating enzyme
LEHSHCANWESIEAGGHKEEGTEVPATLIASTQIERKARGAREFL